MDKMKYWGIDFEGKRPKLIMKVAVVADKDLFIVWVF